MANIPPKKILSILLQPNPCPTNIPNVIMQKTIVQAAIIGAMPIRSIFLNEKSSPNEKSKKMTPMSAQVWMSALSITDMVRGMCGETRNPATM